MKPTTWVTDMRHYIDEETRDLSNDLPERVLNLAVFLERSSPGFPTTFPTAIRTRMSLADAARADADAAAMSSLTWTPRLVRSSGSAHCVVTTD